MKHMVNMVSDTQHVHTCMKHMVNMISDMDLHVHYMELTSLMVNSTPSTTHVAGPLLQM